MAKPNRKTRASAPIPDDLPPMFAPKNGRITRSTLESIKHNETMVAVYKAAAKLARPLTDPRIDIPMSDGTTLLVDTPTSMGVGMGVNQIVGTSPFTIGNTAATVVGHDHAQRIENAMAGYLHTAGGTGVTSIVTPTMQQQMMQAAHVGMQHAQRLAYTNTWTISTTNTIATTATINIQYQVGGTGTGMTGDSLIWTNGGDTWMDTKCACYGKHEWGRKRKHKTSEWERAVDYIEQLTDSQRAWRQWNTVLSTTKESRIQQAARVQHEEQQRQLREQRERIQKMAYEQRRDRAEKLLKAVLNAQQREEYEQFGYFHVYTRSGKKYRIKKNGQHGNVTLVNEKNQEMVSYCIQPIGGLPDADAHVAQKLMLETDEAAFLATANASQIRNAA